VGSLEIAEEIKKTFPDEVIGFTEFRGQVTVSLSKDRIVDICRYLHDSPDMSFDYPTDLCAVDNLGRGRTRFEVIYNLYSTKYRHRIILKAQVPESDPVIDSVTLIWSGMNWHERETYDMFGITFKGHPDMRRILMPEDWEGNPLRKDYPLKGPEKEWRGYRNVKEKSRSFREFQWKQ